MEPQSREAGPATGESARGPGGDSVAAASLFEQAAESAAGEYRVLREHSESGRVHGPDASGVPEEDGREPGVAHVVERAWRRYRAGARKVARSERLPRWRSRGGRIQGPRWTSASARLPGGDEARGVRRFHEAAQAAAA